MKAISLEEDSRTFCTYLISGCSKSALDYTYPANLPACRCDYGEVQCIFCPFRAWMEYWDEVETYAGIKCIEALAGILHCRFIIDEQPVLSALRGQPDTECEIRFLYDDGSSVMVANEHDRIGQKWTVVKNDRNGFGLLRDEIWSRPHSEFLLYAQCYLGNMFPEISIEL